MSHDMLIKIGTAKIGQVHRLSGKDVVINIDVSKPDTLSDTYLHSDQVDTTEEGGRDGNEK